MTCQVLANLPFGFCDKAETPSVAKQSAGRTHRERTRIPERAQPAGLGIELCKPLLTPGEVIEFFIRSMLHLLADCRVARNGCVSLIEALRGDLSGMIDPHQTSGMRFRSCAQVGFGNPFSRTLTCGSAGGYGHGSQRVIDAGEKSVQRSELAFVHPGIIAMRGMPDISIHV